MFGRGRRTQLPTPRPGEKSPEQKSPGPREGIANLDEPPKEPPKEAPKEIPRDTERRPDAGRPPAAPQTSEPALNLLPILPLRGAVIFPRSIVPLRFSNASSLRLLENLASNNNLENKPVGFLTQRSPEPEEPGEHDLFEVGCAAQVLKIVRQPEGGALVVAQGTRRFRLRRITTREPYLQAEVDWLEAAPPASDDKQWEAAVKNLRELALKLLGLTPDVPEEARNAIGNIRDGEQLADLLATNLSLDVPQKQLLLEEVDPVARVRALQTHLTGQIEIAEIQQKLQRDVQSQFGDAQRRAYLHEHLRAIQRELGQGEASTAGQIEELRVRLEEAGLGAEAMAQAERELKRLEFIPPASPEYAVIVSYLEILADLPWKKLSEDSLDLDEAQRILDRDHFDLARVKRRLIEYLAVRKLKPEGRGPILCFVGPPGVGKTSLGQSIADALGRKFARISLGGMHDEAEIRGHRRTYIGSMPGRIIQELRRVGTRNPVLMLDEVDKIGADFRGDPASALLEVLDPRQNHAFEDRYLDLPFDLSRILFIATANYLDPVAPALRDRLEILEIPGYTEREKLAIAQHYLSERQVQENGLRADQCQWEEESLRMIVGDYTHEAGVRELERQIGAVCRGVAAQIARGEREAIVVTPEVVKALLGPARYVREQRLKTNVPGVATGLAYTPLGGEILHVEATRYPGKGTVTLTGQLGEVMRESVEAALSLLRTRAASLGIDDRTFTENDIHVHVPSGAVPKDGPSAGVAMFAALASLFTNTPIRDDLAMTGEITLRGLVLPVGGLNEKSLAAMRAGLRYVLIPKLNEKDLPEIPEEARQQLTFQAVETVDELLDLAFHSQAKAA